MKLLFSLTAILIFTISAIANVNLQNASYVDQWIDFVFPEHTHFMSIERTYSSRSLHQGLFGFGWCTEFDTKLEFNDHHVLLNQCGRTKVFKKEKNFFSWTPQFENKNLNYPHHESIVVEDSLYKYKFPDGTYSFNNLGLLVHIERTPQEQIILKYHGQLLQGMMDNHGHMYTIELTADGKISQITTPDGLSSTYKYNNENLIQVKNAWENNYTMSYDNLHNLTSVSYPDGTQKKMIYDQNKDWLIALKNRKKCQSHFEYSRLPSSSPKYQVQKSSVIKNCNGSVKKTNYHFWMQQKDDNHWALQRSLRIENHQWREVTYDSKLGWPVSFRDQKRKAELNYDSFGRIKNIRINNSLNIELIYKGKLRTPSSLKTPNSTVILKEPLGAQRHFSGNLSSELTFILREYIKLSQ